MSRRAVLARLAACAAVVATLAIPTGAQAYFRGGFVVGVPFPFFYPGPVVVAPPVVYAAPPVVYAPPPVVYDPSAPSAQPVSARSCDASPYVCPLDRPTPAGAPCSCPASQGRAYGTSR